MKLKIGYFADGPWAHEALKRLKDDRDMEVLFICVRYDKRDEVLVKYAQEYGILALTKGIFFYRKLTPLQMRTIMGHC